MTIQIQIKKTGEAPDHPPAIFLMGPTASGKTNIALEISKYLPIEIVSVDSALVYRHMNIGTSKPNQKSLRTVPHHLIDLIEPDERYSVAQFRNDALIAMQQIIKNGNIPLLVGGTMLYFYALLEGLSKLPPANTNTRLMIHAMAKESSWPTLHKKLQQLDPVSALRIKPTDSQRIERALEVCYLAEKPMSELLKKPKPSYLPYRVINIALIPSNREILHQRIADRFEKMLKLGLINEVRTIRNQFDLKTDVPSMRCVGYRQTCMYLDNQIDLIELNKLSLAATRQLAKRQLTWLRSMKGSKEFDCLAPNLLQQILEHLKEHSLKILV